MKDIYPPRPALTGSNSSTVKWHNLRAILLMLLRHEHVSRARLAELTGLSTTTISNLVTELLEQGIVVEEGTEFSTKRRGAGRPRMALRLVPEARYAIGIHIGVGSIWVAITDLRANIVDSRSLIHPPDQPARAVLEKTAGLAQQLVEDSRISRPDIIGVGVGASGLVNPNTGLNVLAPNLGWQNAPIQEWMTEWLGWPVCVDNNVRAMALGEALFGVAQEVRVLAFVYARIGVGSGFVVDGQPYRGSGAGAGEIGHMTIMPDGGEVCRCGNSGCLETLVSEPAIMRLAHQLAEQKPDGLLARRLAEQDTIDQVFEIARAGDTATRNMLTERARYMGIALANMVNVINPELIVLGGILAQGQDLFLPTIEATLRRRAFADLGSRVRLQPTGLSHQVGLIGAAALALTSFFYQQNDTLG